MLDYDPVVAMMMPTAIVMPIVMVAMLDHDPFSVCDGWRRNSDRADSNNDVSKFLHLVLLHVSEG
jgi:hypothetical protein